MTDASGRMRPNIQSSRFFEPAALAGMERMRFTTHRRVEGRRSGRHVSKRIGGAGEFVDYREYTPGDDVRRVDWKAMGRMGRAYLKLFQDETDLNCTLLLDCSGSMSQGSIRPMAIKSKGSGDAGAVSKLEWMQYFSTALSHLILLGRDAVGLGVIRNGLSDYIPPTSSLQSRMLIHETIQQLTAHDGTDLAQGLDDLWIRTHRRGVLVILSDFLLDSPDRLMAGIRKFRARGWEVIAIHLIHPDEQNLPEGNAFRFVGLEQDGFVNCQLAEVRRDYQRKFADMVQTTRTGLSSVGCDYHRVLTTQSYLDVLRNFLVVRNA